MESRSNSQSQPQLQPQAQQAVIYARVSTDEQAQRGLSIPSQIEHCQKYAREHGLAVARVFQDEAESATSANRPEFLEMIEYATKANPDVGAVIVYDTSRFARNREDAVVYKRMLEKRGVKVHYATQLISDDPEGAFLLGMLEVIDEHYSRALARVVKRGMIASAQKGNWHGMPPFGYRVSRTSDGKIKRRLEVEPREAEGVKLAFELFESSYGARAIAEKLNEKGYRSRYGRPINANAVRLLLRNPAYTGAVVFNRRRVGRHTKACAKPQDEWVVVPDVHEPLVSKERFEAVQRELQRRGLERRPGELKSYRRFAGLVQCALCGSTAQASTGTSHMGTLYFYYGCRTRATRSVKLCPGMRVRADVLEETLIEEIQDKIFSDERIEAFIEYVKAKARELDQGRCADKVRVQRKLDAIQGKLRKVVLLAETDAIDAEEARRRTKELQEERRELHERYARIDGELSLKNLLPTRALIEGARRELRRLVAEAEPRVQREFFKRFVKSVKTDGKTVEVTYNLGGLAAGPHQSPVQVRNSRNVSGP